MSCGIAAWGRPAFESGRLCHGDGTPAGGARRRRAFILPEYPSRKDFLEDYRRRAAWVRALYDRVVPK